MKQLDHMAYIVSVSQRTTGPCPLSSSFQQCPAVTSTEFYFPKLWHTFRQSKIIRDTLGSQCWQFTCRCSWFTAKGLSTGLLRKLWRISTSYSSLSFWLMKSQLQEEISCETGVDCPVDCEYNDWKDFGGVGRLWRRLAHVSTCWQGLLKRTQSKAMESQKFRKFCSDCASRFTMAPNMQNMSSQVPQCCAEKFMGFAKNILRSLPISAIWFLTFPHWSPWDITAASHRHQHKKLCFLLHHRPLEVRSHYPYHHHHHRHHHQTTRTSPQHCCQQHQ